jgi:hypothetical protein
MLRLPPKVVSWLCVLQMTVILSGYFDADDAQGLPSAGGL